MLRLHSSAYVFRASKPGKQSCVSLSNTCLCKKQCRGEESLNGKVELALINMNNEYKNGERERENEREKYLPISERKKE